MKIYIYDGPVMLFDRCVAHKWHGETYAASPQKAKSNLAYQFKLQYQYGPSTKISMPADLLTGSEKED